MDKLTDGGPAFPRLDRVDADKAAGAGFVATSAEGMSLRDWFAGQALAGILSGPASRDGVPMKEWFDIPEQAYRLADAMLRARLALEAEAGWVK